jgi:HlyD family secretion protein
MPNEVFIFSEVTKEVNSTPPTMAVEVHRELHSEYVEDIVSNKPSFIIRFGNLFFLLILCLIVIACWFIQYPTLISASAKLTSINAPKPINAIAGGKLIKLFTIEGQPVKAGEIIGQLETTANYIHVSELMQDVDSIEHIMNSGKTEKLPFYFEKRFEQLGELQQAYQLFAQAYYTFDNYLQDGFYSKKKRMLLIDKLNLEKLHNYLLQQQTLQQQDLALTQKTFDANKSLNDNKVISDFDFRNEQSKLLSKKLTLPQINSSIVNNENQQNEKEKEMLELENTIRQQKATFQQVLYTFKSQLDDWKRKYLLVASIDGKVAYASFVEENQQLQPNQTVCFINPENTHYFAELIIPQSNFGKVATGQKVLLRFASYPYQEYGSVMGKIEFISNRPNEKGYLAKASLDNALVTTYKKKIYYRDGLVADAEIITKDMRLLERFYYSFLGNVNR